MFQVWLSFQDRLIDLVTTIPERCGTSKTDIGRERYGVSKLDTRAIPNSGQRSRIRLRRREFQRERIEFDQGLIEFDQNVQGPKIEILEIEKSINTTLKSKFWPTLSCTFSELEETTFHQINQAPNILLKASNCQPKIKNYNFIFLSSWGRCFLSFPNFIIHSVYLWERFKCRHCKGDSLLEGVF